MTPVLELTHVEKRFGGLRVACDLSLTVGEQEIVAVIGPNGAGKSTLFNLITGIYQPDGGDIKFRGTSLARQAPHAITHLGIARTFQTLRLFLNMSVLENVTAAAYAHAGQGLLPTLLRTRQWRQEEAMIQARAEEKLAFFGTRLQGYRHDQPAYALSYANRRRLEIARAMMTGATLLLLDEPTAGMNPVEAAEMTALVGELRAAGYTILLIEHNMHLVESIADRVVVLDHGEKIAEGSFAEVTSRAEVITAYLGRRHEELG
jgi:branched-chain amino acid transport system ATP-binding protein